MESVNDFRDKPTGTLRINTAECAARRIFEPVVLPFLERYPDMSVDLVTEGRFVDIVASGFRRGHSIGRGRSPGHGRGALQLAEGHLLTVLEDWSPHFPGLCLYYPPHRHVSAGLRAFVDLIRELDLSGGRRARVEPGGPLRKKRTLRHR